MDDAVAVALVAASGEALRLRVKAAATEKGQRRVTGELPRPLEERRQKAPGRPVHGLCSGDSTAYIEYSN
jgi:hypothetical protein